MMLGCECCTARVCWGWEVGFPHFNEISPVASDPNEICAYLHHIGKLITPLMLAAHKGKMEIVELLLETGADTTVNQKRISLLMTECI